MLRCEFLCHVLKALFFIKIALKLSYFCKKMQNFQGLEAPPQTPRCLRRLGAKLSDPQNSPPPLRITGYAPDHIPVSVPTLRRASERKFFRGYEGQYRAHKSYWALQALSGPMLSNHFLSNGCRASFKSEGITIFAYSSNL